MNDSNFYLYLCLLPFPKIAVDKLRLNLLKESD